MFLSLVIQRAVTFSITNSSGNQINLGWKIKIRSYALFFLVGDSLMRGQRRVSMFTSIPSILVYVHSGTNVCNRCLQFTGTFPFCVVIQCSLDLLEVKIKIIFL